MSHAWKQQVHRQSGKEKKGGLKEKEPSWFLKIQIQSQTVGKQIWREVFPSDLTPLKPCLGHGD